jgi:hypothetical protein
VSNLAGDQVDIGQYFSYPGRKFKHVASEWIVDVDGWPVLYSSRHGWRIAGAKARQPRRSVGA